MKKIIFVVVLFHCFQSYSYASEQYSIESIEGFEGTVTETPSEPEHKPKASTEQIRLYRLAIHDAVMSKFVQSDKHKNQQCEVRVHLNESGQLMFDRQSIKIVKGDGILCHSIWKAVNATEWPTPENIDVHNEFKTIFLHFIGNDFSMTNHYEYKGALWSVLG